MIVTTLTIVVSLTLVVVIGLAFCAGVIIGVGLAGGVAFFYRRSLPKSPQQPPGGWMMDPNYVRKQREIVEKVKGMYDNKLSSRQQEIVDQELEKVIVGKK